jgi:hypothetical protein
MITNIVADVTRTAMRMAGLGGVKFVLDEETAKKVWKGAIKVWSNHDQLVMTLALKLKDLTSVGMESEVDLIKRVARVFHSGDKAHSLPRPSLSFSLSLSLSLSLAHSLSLSTSLSTLFLLQSFSLSPPLHLSSCSDSLSDPPLALSTPLPGCHGPDNWARHHGYPPCLDWSERGCVEAA